MSHDASLCKCEVSLLIAFARPGMNHDPFARPTTFPPHLRMVPSHWVVSTRPHLYIDMFICHTVAIRPVREVKRVYILHHSQATFSNLTCSCTMIATQPGHGRYGEREISHRSTADQRPSRSAGNAQRVSKMIPVSCP